MRKPRLSSLILAFELGVFEALGLDGERILSLSGLSRERAADPHGFIDLETRFRWWDAALEVSGDPALGLRVGQAMPVGALGSFEYLLRNCASLTEVLERAHEFVALVDDSALIEVRTDGPLAALRVSRRGGYANTPPEIDCLFAAWLTIIQKEWSSVQLSSVHLARRTPRDRAVYTRYFGCPVHFEAEHNEVRFSAALLAMRQARADSNLARVLEEHVRHQLAQLPNEDPSLQNAPCRAPQTARARGTERRPVGARARDQRTDLAPPARLRGDQLPRALERCSPRAGA